MRFTAPLLLTVPVMPRVKKYLAVHYPTGIQLSPSDMKLLSIWSLVQTEKVKMRTHGRVHKPLSQTITLIVSQANGSRSQVLLNDSEVRMVNKMFDHFMLQEFFALVAKNRRPGKGWLAESIREFTDRYDFSEDDLAEKTLKMAFHRNDSNEFIGFDDAELNTRPLTPMHQYESGTLQSGMLPSMMAA